MTAKVPKGFQPPFALHGVSRNLRLTGIKLCERNYTCRVENFISLTDLPKCSKRSVDEGVDFLKTPARTNDPRCQVAVYRADGPNCCLRPIGADALQDQDCNWLAYVLLEPSSLPNSLEPRADRGDGLILLRGGRDIPVDDPLDQIESRTPRQGRFAGSEYSPDHGFRLVGQRDISHGTGGHQEICSTQRDSVADWRFSAQRLSASARYTPRRWLIKVTPCSRQPFREFVMIISCSGVIR